MLTDKPLVLPLQGGFSGVAHAPPVFSLFSFFFLRLGGGKDLLHCLWVASVCDQRSVAPGLSRCGQRFDVVSLPVVSVPVTVAHILSVAVAAAPAWFVRSLLLSCRLSWFVRSLLLSCRCHLLAGL